jgi:hypothetical protein
MGKPLTRETTVEDAIPSDWRPSGDGKDMPDLPEFLRRRGGCSGRRGGHLRNGDQQMLMTKLSGDFFVAIRGPEREVAHMGA